MAASSTRTANRSPARRSPPADIVEEASGISTSSRSDEELDRSITDRQGRFRLTFEDTEVSASEDQELSHPWSRPAIVAWAPGFGPAWPETLAKDVTEDKPLRARPR